VSFSFCLRVAFHLEEVEVEVPVPADLPGVDDYDVFGG